ncbi:MAG: RNA polymerase-associated protein RapA [Bacteriovoracaceae bacterium]|jgi:ATP-dependent helicase HepA|nr:RNA polymerase-associated protein RapA [Bacteriovoracaceae bacterium]
MSKVIVGQRYMSEAEPELGLGIIEKIEDKTLVVSFPATEESRRYGRRTAPLKRVKFEEGDEVTSNQEQKFIVSKVIESSTGILAYLGNKEGEEIIECDLLDSINFHTPLEKILNGTSDSQSFFNLRYQTVKIKRWLASLPVKGLMGGRVSLIDHQLYLVNEVIKLQYPRVLLSDEVGLGKTIEAGLILHRLIITNKIERVLIVLPNTLCHQWFVEMLIKYNLSFTVINEQTNLEPEINPFDQSNLVITSIQLLCGSDIASKLMTESEWDMLVVDEAHSLEYTEQGPGVQYQKVEELSKKIPGLLLLTATPEMFGMQGHFSRLKLLDPNRFHDFAAYQKESIHYREMAEIAKKVRAEVHLNDHDIDYLDKLNISKDDKTSIIPELLDRHGTGRIYFRNTRKVMTQVYDFFPKRILKSYELSHEDENKYFNEGEDDFLTQALYKMKLLWLSNYLNSNRNKKTLLICRSKKLILKLDKDLKETTVGNKPALFHSDLSLIARDRQAAYFHEPEGANILLCTEIGSEGRNFEFAHDLILLDLPKNPDLLEQRIGRLDRIGQTQDITIHVPYIKNSFEEIYFRWYHQAINGFEKTSKGAMKILAANKSAFSSALEDCQDFLQNDHSKLNNFIKKSKVEYQDFEVELENGRDILIEINSFNSKKAKQIKKQIQEIDESPKLREFLDRVYDQFGVDCEDLDGDTQFIKPSHNMFVPHFPYLPEEGFSYTFNRDKAQDREDLIFMTFDHPMVVGIIEMILGQEYGNATIATRNENKSPKVFLELFFLLGSVAPKYLELDKFLPPTHIRVLLSPEGNNFSDKWNKEMLDSKLIDADKAIRLKVARFSKPELKNLIKKAHEIAREKSIAILEQSKADIKKVYLQQVSRLLELQKKNKQISDEEIENIKRIESELYHHLNLSESHLDSFRFIY